MFIQLATLLTCKRCGHQWRPRQVDVRMCPKCKSVRWDEAKKPAAR